MEVKQQNKGKQENTGKNIMGKKANKDNEINDKKW